MRNDRDSTFPGRFWHALDDGRIQCDLCPRACRLKNGQRGLCFVRQNRAGRMVLTTYGRSSGFCIDPIEKKPLHHFLPGTPVLSFGTAGCNLACKFCQNWNISKSRERDTLCDAADPAMIARAARELHCRSVAFTYNDPVIFHEYAVDTAKECRQAGIRTVAVTAGYMCPDPRVEFFTHMDAVNVDLKAFNDTFYKRTTGAHLEPVLDTLRFIRHETNAWMELTTLLIPGLNDSPREIHEMTSWVVEHLGPDVPMHFTAFHPAWKMQHHPAAAPKTLARAREIARGNGVRYAYTGNIHDRERNCTYCHNCGAPVIGRDWFSIRDWNLSDDGRCTACGKKCAGVFDRTAGSWGPRCQPIHLNECLLA